MGNNEWMVGVALNIIGSISINAGTNLMKLGHNRRARDVCRVTNNCSSTVLTEAPSKQKQSDIDLDVRMVPSESSTVTEDSGNGSPDVAAAQSASTGKLLHRQGSSKSANSEASSKDGTERTPAGAAVVKPIYKYPVWAIGSSMFVVGNILNFASFGFAAQSLLSALGAIQFVSNVVFARFVLGEPVTWFTLIATAIIVGACMILVFFGSHQTMHLTAEAAMELYKNPAYYGYLIAVAVLAPLLYVAYRAATMTEKRMKANRSSVSKTMAALTLSRPFLYASYSALIGTQSVLYGKTVSELINATAKGDNQFTSWYTYVAMLCLLVTAVFWMYHLNKGLRLFQAVLIVPTMQIMWTLLSIVSGGLYYQEFDKFTALQFGMFGLGVALILAGVLMLTVTTNNAKPVSSPASAAAVARASATSSAPARASATTSLAPVPSTVAAIVAAEEQEQEQHDAASLKDALAFAPVASTHTTGDIADEAVKISMVSQRRVRFDSEGDLHDTPSAASTPAFVRRQMSRDSNYNHGHAHGSPAFRRANSKETLLRQLWRESKDLARQSMGLDDDAASLVLNLMGMPVAATSALHHDIEQQDDTISEGAAGATSESLATV